MGHHPCYNHNRRERKQKYQVILARLRGIIPGFEGGWYSYIPCIDRGRKNVGNTRVFEALNAYVQALQIYFRFSGTNHDPAEKTHLTNRIILIII